MSALLRNLLTMEIWPLTCLIEKFPRFTAPQFPLKLKSELHTPKSIPKFEMHIITKFYAEWFIINDFASQQFCRFFITDISSDRYYLQRAEKCAYFQVDKHFQLLNNYSSVSVLRHSTTFANPVSITRKSTPSLARCSHESLREISGVMGLWWSLTASIEYVASAYYCLYSSFFLHRLGNRNSCSLSKDRYAAYRGTNLLSSPFDCRANMK